MNGQGRIFIVLLVGILCIVSAFSLDITNVWIGSSPNNYTTIITTVGSEISINNQGLVIYISSATNDKLCFNVVSASQSTSLEAMCIQKNKYTRLSGFLIYYLGNNSNKLGLFVSNGLLPTVLLNLGKGPFYVNKNIEIDVVPILGPSANISLTIVVNNTTVINYPYFTKDNCQGDSCKTIINFKPNTVGYYTIKVKDCYKGFCVYNSTNITVVHQNTNVPPTLAPPYECKTYSLKTGTTYDLYNGGLILFLNKIYESSGAMVVNLCANNKVFNIKPNSGNVSVGDFNISVLSVYDLTEESTNIYSGYVKLLICKKTSPSPYSNVHINVSTKNPAIGSVVRINANIEYIENILAKLEIETPDGNIIDLGTCAQAHCSFNVSFKVPEAGEYIIILHYCLPTGCYEETSSFYAGTQTSLGNNMNNVMKIYKSGVYKIPANTTVIIYTPNGKYKLFFGNIQKRLGTSSYFVNIWYGNSVYSGYKNVVVFNKKDLFLKVLGFYTNNVVYSKCVNVEDCYTYYNGYIRVLIDILGTSKNGYELLNLQPGMNMIYLNVEKTLPLDYFEKYCNYRIVEFYQLTPDGWIASDNIDLDNPLFIVFAGLIPCSVPVPISPKGEGVKNLDLLFKTLKKTYKGYEITDKITIKLD